MLSAATWFITGIGVLPTTPSGTSGNAISADTAPFTATAVHTTTRRHLVRIHAATGTQPRASSTCTRPSG